jgi:23S rRNA (pseudouridine1915-N3)-methyltransferase
MNITIITVGKKHAPEFVDAIAEFEKRIKASVSLEWVLINPIPVKKEGEIPQALSKEGDLVVGALEQGDFAVALDEHGKEKTTVEFSELIQKNRVEGYKRLVFIIGGSYGLAKEVKDRANSLIALSKMTFPHQLVRVVLVEQIYRALSLLSGGKYHHE